jgi:hypothetical protein
VTTVVAVKPTKSTTKARPTVPESLRVMPRAAPTIALYSGPTTMRGCGRLLEVGRQYKPSSWQAQSLVAPSMAACQVYAGDTDDLAPLAARIGREGSNQLRPSVECARHSSLVGDSSGPRRRTTAILSSLRSFHRHEAILERIDGFTTRFPEAHVDITTTIEGTMAWFGTHGRLAIGVTVACAGEFRPVRSSLAYWARRRGDG